MKITALPFAAGSAGYAFFYSGDYTFTVASCVIMAILCLTGQVKLL